MQNIDIIIGANYGDEGKGLATNYFCSGKKSIVVLHNGGFQRGHTVIHNGIRHVFHAFSAGTFQKADTYYAKTFILNPIFFRMEWEDLVKKGVDMNNLHIYANPMCRITLPFDMMINSIVEDSRGEEKHGSCGFGIFETIKRNEKYPFYVEMAQKEKEKIPQLLYTVREKYLFERLLEYGLEKISVKKLQEVFDENILYKYMEDLEFMLNHIEIKDTQVICGYDEVVFEGCQGLLLDQGYIGQTAHLTPSNTGLTNPAEIIKNLTLLDFIGKVPVNVHYITRTYLTRHGAGEFPGMCMKEEINPTMYDKTNVPNNFQGTIRYGKIDIHKLVERVIYDAKKIPGCNFDIFVTHLNETDDCFITEEGKIPVKEIPLVKYFSKNEEACPKKR